MGIGRASIFTEVRFTCLRDTLKYVKSGFKNLTINVPSDLVQQAKVIAAKRGTSINALLTKALEELASSDDEYTAAGLRFLNSPTRYEVNRNWKREDLYDRR